MDLKKLDVFLTVSDLGNFTKAGEKLGYTQSGITQMMKSLEQEVGVPLFVKRHRGVTLTEEGVSLLPAIRNLLSANENLNQEISFLKGAKKIKHDTNGDSYELAISVDVSDVERLGKFKELYNTSISTACIDHHVSNKGFGDFCYIDPDASSACEALVDILDLEKISLNAAQSLYLGIVHDTGVFKYGATSRHTMEVAGALLEKGVDSAYIIDETFYKKSYKKSKTIMEMDSARWF